MYYKLKYEWRKELFMKARKKTINLEELIKKLRIARSTFFAYKNGSRAIPERLLKELTKFTNEKIEIKDIDATLPDNWKQVLGGKNCVKLKKRRGTFIKQLKDCQKSSSIFMKKRHRELKMLEPERYYKSQYEKFKKIGDYKYETLNGEKVRNKLERDIANILKKYNLKYEYEPYVNIDNKAFFPDFIINKKVIIEATAWRGFDKAIKLKEKIKHLKKNYKIYIVIPKDLYKYYKTLNNHLVLGLDEFVPLAQSGRAFGC